MWGRPLPLKLKASLIRRGVAEQLDRLFPPLEGGEWEQLRRWALGIDALPEVPKRRAKQRDVVAREKARMEGTESLLNKHYILNRIDFAHKEVNHAVVRRRDIHALTDRFRRRLYGEIWQQTPKITWVNLDGTTNPTGREVEHQEVAGQAAEEPIRGKWLVEWGQGKGHTSHALVAKAQPMDAELFEGLDEEAAERPKRQERRRGERKERTVKEE
jgi:hypothetical protein